VHCLVFSTFNLMLIATLFCSKFEFHSVAKLRISSVTGLVQVEYKKLPQSHFIANIFQVH